MASHVGRKVLLVLPLLLAICVSSITPTVSDTATPTFQQATVSVKDLKTPQNVTINSGAVWYRCGLSSAKKIKFSVKSNIKLDSYVASGEDAVKKIKFDSNPSAVTVDNVLIKAKYKYEGGTFCDQKTTCEKTVGGRFGLLYDRCLAVAHVRGSDTSPATFTIQLQLENDNLVIFIWAAIAIGIALFLASILCCICKVMSCCCCPTPFCCC